MNKKQYILVFVGALGIYLASTGISYWVFGNTGSGKSGDLIVDEKITGVNPGDGFKVDPSLPKTEVCPLNGAYFTKPEKAVWEARRPLAVMIENSVDARPQSGLTSADIVYEAVAEGGITRFMGVFYCGIAEKTEFAPVRSARTYFVDWVSEYDALYNHVGGAGVCSDNTVDERAKALCQIRKYGIKDLDQFGIQFPTCYRNPDRLSNPVATEHQMVCVSDGLYTEAEKRGWTDVDQKGISWDKNFISWKFKDEENSSNRGSTNAVSYKFWDNQPAYAVSWAYDPATNTYKRSNGEQAQTDLNNSKPVEAKTVIIQFTKETGPVDTHKHMLYTTTGSGKAIIFMDGKATEGTWKKKDRASRTLFYDASGKEIPLNRGLVWISVLPTGNEVTY
jgi:hypothetical protein